MPNPVTTSRPSLPAIGDIFIDTTALSSIAHMCLPEACSHSGGCCGYYDVYIHQQELDGLIGMMPPASKYAPHLRDNDGYINLFGEEDNGEFSIDKSEEGGCLFGYADDRNRTWCSLHTAALDLGIPLIDAKPMACLLWPLALTETEPITLSVQDGALAFSCNQSRPERSDPLDKGIAEIVRGVFGQDFLDALYRILRSCV